MNREILFRGKRTDNGKWVYGYLFCIWEEAYILWGTTNGIPNMVRVIPKTVGQYTGLTDKNGKKIFEGDVVCHENGYDDSHREIGKVFWEEEVCQWRRTSNGSFHHGKIATYRIGSKCVYEIIGNIHDNPELIGGGGMDDVKLNPCPFCGGVAMVEEELDEDGEICGYCVECQSYPCNAEISGWETPELAAEAWNRRAYELPEP